jgi:hypothetical protein
MRRSFAFAAAAALLGAGCAAGARGPQSCEIEVVGLESHVQHDRGVDVSYRVQGYAGTRGIVSLVARRRDGGYLSGKGVEVGPGPFVAIVEQKLTSPAAGYVALLEVAQGRCRDNAPRPR